MRALLERLFDIRRGEAGRSLIMFLYGFFLLSAYLILKPVRNSLFLTKFGPEQLVFMYMIIALAAGFIATGYGWIARRITLLRLIAGSIIIILVNLALFWWLMRQDTPGLVYVFYVWVSLFGVITTSQFWLLANHLFDAREAKRLFPFIGAGAIAGGLAGSKITNMFATLVGTENLLFICMGLMILCLVMVLAVWPMRKESPARRASRDRTEMGGLWQLLTSSDHLKLLAGIIGLTVMVSTFVDFQFNTVIAGAFQEKDELTAFLGDFFFYLSVASLALQFLFSSRILRRFGVGTAVLILPLSLLLGSAAIFVWPVLASAVVLKMADGGLRYSINKAAGELLYLPIAAATKDRVKALMDVVGDRFARGVGGGMLFVVQYLLNWTVGYVAILSAVLIAAWVALALRMRKVYSNSFRSALELRTLDTDQIRVQLRDAGSIDALRAALDSADTRQVRFLLELTANTEDERLREPLWSLLDHEDPAVRFEALRQFTPIGTREDASAIAEYVSDNDPEVRELAMQFLATHDTDRLTRELTRLIESDRNDLRVTALRCALGQRVRSALPGGSGQSIIEPIIKSGDVSALEGIARALAHLESDAPERRFMLQLLQHPEATVANRAAESAGILQDRSWLPAMIARLPEARVRAAFTNALCAYGTRILGTLRDHLLDPSVPDTVRQRLPRIVSLIGGPDAINILQNHFAEVSGEVRHQCLKGLNRIRRRDAAAQFDSALAHRELEAEARHYYRLAALKHQLNGDAGDPGARLLARTMDQRMDRHLESAFRFAGQIWNPADMLYAYTAATRKEGGKVASAIEFLDTVWDRSTKEVMFPILESRDEATLVQIARQRYGVDARTPGDAIRLILEADDYWLRCCAVHWAMVQGASDLLPAIQTVSAGASGALKETTLQAIEILGPSARKGSDT